MSVTVKPTVPEVLPPTPPALTPEQWADVLAWRPAAVDRSNSFLGDSVDDFDGYRNARHALVAIGLYGQPFGFTHEDAGLLNTMANYYDMMTREVVRATSEPTEGQQLRSLACRIAALLPPSPEETP